MKTLLTVLFLLIAATLWAADEKIRMATDPSQAGPDYALQGEYLDKSDNLGAEVIALGDHKFQINILPGGLRGEGGDYARHIEANTTAEDGKGAVTSKDDKWTGTLEKGKLTLKSEGKEYALEHVVRKSKTLGEKPPEGAVVLFDGSNTDQWPNGKVVDGNLLGSDIDSKMKFGDCKLHVEFRLSFMPYARGQGRSNSGVYLQHRYEIQVLDSFGLSGANNECGAIYSQSAPLVNMCYPPLTWQTYDVEFTAAKFDNAGKKIAPAVISVRQNGVLVQDKFEIKGPTGGGRPETNEPGPVHLQGHGGQVQYRNIWAVPK